MRIDVQCHLFPKSFIKEISREGGQLRALDPDSRGRRVVVDTRTGDEITFFVQQSPYDDPEKHVKDMEEFKIDVQILSLPPPGVDRIEDPSEAMKLAKMINDELATIIAKYPGKFEGLATIPMNDPELAVEEVRRSVEELGFRGAIISSNTQGRFYDSEEYYPVFRALEKLSAPVFIHPTNPVASEQLGQDYKLTLIYGWPLDTTMLISRLAFSGTLGRFPGLKVIAAHGGGMVPFFAGRIDMLTSVAAGRGKKIETSNPLGLFKDVYFDAALFNSDSLELLVKFAGDDRVLYSSDYPFGQNLGKRCYESSIAMMKNASLDESVKERIYSKNLLTLFHM